VALDYLRTMQPETGLIRDLTVLPPNGETHLLWSVAADIGQQDFSGGRMGEDDYPLTLVGACGAQRADAFVRACGEAVERAALLPTSPLADDPSAPALDSGALWRPRPTVASGTVDTRSPADDAMYAAFDLATGDSRRIPAAAVDYPVPDPQLLSRFDPTPSGAAAGPSRAAAIDSALREILERDAAMIAWARQTRLPRLDPAAIAGGEDGATAQPMTRLLAAGEQVGLAPVAAVVPTGVPGADCVIAVLIDGEAQIAAAGLAVCDTTAAAAVKAVQEALQVRTVLLGVAERYRGEPLPPTVDSDLDRARFWARPEAMAAMQRWISTFAAAVNPPSLVRDVDFAPPEWATAVPGAAVVDLTPRLPAAVRELGWHAVKAVAPRHQPLLMSERHDWSWNRQRLAMPEVRWGLRCGVRQGALAECPHPFI
jgi:ribosomal protein S12 methylthiotransferase accessory factor